LSCLEINFQFLIFVLFWFNTKPRQDFLNFLILMKHHYEAFFDCSGKILSSDWSSKSFEAFVASSGSHSKSNTSDKINITWYHTFQRLMKASTITPTNLSGSFCVHLCNISNPRPYSWTNCVYASNKLRMLAT